MARKKAAQKVESLDASADSVAPPSEDAAVLSGIRRVSSEDRILDGKSESEWMDELEQGWENLFAQRPSGTDG